MEEVMCVSEKYGKYRNQAGLRIVFLSDAPVFTVIQVLGSVIRERKDRTVFFERTEPGGPICRSVR